MMGKRKIPAFLLVLFLMTVMLSQIAYAKERRVFDEAGLFTAAEKQHLEDEISKFREKYPADLAVVTIEDAEGKTSEEFADDFYDYNGLGAGEDSSGALFLINMEQRELWISTLGETASVLTDRRIEQVLDAAYEGAADGDFAECALAAVAEIGRFMEAGVPAGQYNVLRKQRSLRWYEILAALAAAAAAASLPCIATVNQYKMKKEQRQALNYRLAYRGTSAYRFDVDQERFLNRSVIQERIPRNTGGGGGSGRGGSRTTLHRSSSGRSHGGGGRRF